jgi:hypothetical protein
MELNSIEFQIEDFRQCADEQGFRQTRYADEQAMALGKQRHQDLFNDFVLTDDHLANLAEHGVALVGKFFDLGNFVLLNLSGLHPDSFSIRGHQFIQAGLCLFRLLLIPQCRINIG